MSSEFLREAAVLVFVFVPLDLLFESSGNADRAPILLYALLCAAFLFALGVIIEKLRDRE